MPTIYDEPKATEPKHYKAEAEASAADIKEVGGKKSLIIQNILFQSDADSQAKTNSLLARLKDRKTYFSMSSEFCPVPVERRDSAIVEERVTSTESINHTGLIRGIQLSVTPTSQVLTVILEE